MHIFGVEYAEFVIQSVAFSSLTQANIVSRIYGVVHGMDRHASMVQSAASSLGKYLLATFIF